MIDYMPVPSQTVGGMGRLNTGVYHNMIREYMDITADGPTGLPVLRESFIILQLT